jgi:cellulose synthase/poly-beta-1,6-N-acetylglucosamine synthase-like glycosyltransferase
MSKNAPFATVVVPTRSPLRCLTRTLDALAHQDFDDPFEVIVSLSGAAAAAAAPLSALATPYPLRVLVQERGGRAAACNRALESARGAVVAILDDDMQPVRGWLSAHVRRHEPTSRLCTVGPVPVEIGRADAPVAAYVATRFERHHERLSRPEHRFGLRDFYSGNIAVRRELLLELGGFDARFVEYGNEDLELFLRLTNAGVTVVYEPRALARQRYDKDLAALAADTFQKGGTAVQLACLHPHTAAQLRLGEFWNDSFRWRSARASLLAVSRRLPRFEQLVVRTACALERVPAVRRFGFYRFFLDFMYWRGAEAALNAAPARQLADVARVLRHGPVRLLLHR